MSIQSWWGNVTSDVEGWFNNKLGNIKTKLESVVGTTTTRFTNLWDGGFAGISEQGIEELKNELKNFCSAIEDQIASFDEEGEIANAYKGVIADAARDFIRAIEEILKAYVSTMKVNISEADLAFKNYKAGSQAISQNVIADAADIRKEAQSIRLD